MIANWKGLEKAISYLLKDDRAILPKNSGATKGEEDVVGDHTLTQCKYTQNKNMSILDEDLDRLTNKAKQLNKIPLFITSSENKTILCMPINNDNETIVKLMLAIAILDKKIDQIENLIPSIKYPTMLKTVIDMKVKAVKLFNEIIIEIKGKLNSIEKKLKIKEDDITMGDLFEGVEDD